MSNTSLYRRRAVHNIYKRCSLEEEKCLSDEEKRLRIVGSTKKINKIGRKCVGNSCNFRERCYNYLHYVGFVYAIHEHDPTENTIRKGEHYGKDLKENDGNCSDRFYGSSTWKHKCIRRGSSFR